MIWGSSLSSLLEARPLSRKDFLFSLLLCHTAWTWKAHCGEGAALVPSDTLKFFFITFLLLWALTLSSYLFLCLFPLSFCSHSTQYTQDDGIDFQSHKDPLTNPPKSLWKIRGKSFYSTEKLLFCCLHIFSLKIFLSSDLTKVRIDPQTQRFAPKSSLWPGMTKLEPISGFLVWDCGNEEGMSWAGALGLTSVLPVLGRSHTWSSSFAPLRTSFNSALKTTWKLGRNRCGEPSLLKCCFLGGIYPPINDILRPSPLSLWSGDG